MSGENVFEIREYLDGSGAPTKNEVVDITRELEYFQKIGGDKIEAQEALDEEKRFIRELALMSAKVEEGKAKRRMEQEEQSTNHHPSDDLDDIFDKLEQEDMKPEVPAPRRVFPSTAPAMKTSTAANDTPAAVTAAKAAPAVKKSGSATGASGSGWKSGFLSSSNSATKKKTTPSAATKASASSPQASQPMSNSSIIESVAAEVLSSTQPNAKSTDVNQVSENLSKAHIVSTPAQPTAVKETVTSKPPTKIQAPDAGSKKAVTFNQQQTPPQPPMTSSDEPVVTENVFSQKKQFMQGAAVRARSGMLPLPKVPKGEKTAIAFNGNVMERQYVDER